MDYMAIGAESDTERELFLDVGCEGGGYKVYRRQSDSNYSYWVEGNTWGLDSNDNEVVSSWRSKETEHFSSHLEPVLLMYLPVFIHHDGWAWFQQELPHQVELYKQQHGAPPWPHKVVAWLRAIEEAYLRSGPRRS